MAPYSHSLLPTVPLLRLLPGHRPVQLLHRRWLHSAPAALRRGRVASRRLRLAPALRLWLGRPARLLRGTSGGRATRDMGGGCTLRFRWLDGGERRRLSERDRREGVQGVSRVTASYILDPLGDL